MMKFPTILLLAVALINVFVANSFSVSRVNIPSQRGNQIVTQRSASRVISRLFAGKKDEPVEEEETKKGPGGKDVIRGILWATTPWIFNSYEVSHRLIS